jgi:nucleotide-binding universal stress UspA family protein
MSQHWTSIVVGVDGTESSRAALAFALSEATLHGARVDVITAWEPPQTYSPTGVLPDLDSWRQTAQQVQDGQLSAVLAELDQPPVISRSILQGPAGALLVDVARASEFLVVGTGRKGALKRAVLGSVSEHCVRHATCPVAVVPGRHRETNAHGVTAEPAIAGL